MGQWTAWAVYAVLVTSWKAVSPELNGLLRWIYFLQDCIVKIGLYPLGNQNILETVLFWYDILWSYINALTVELLLIALARRVVALGHDDLAWSYLVGTVSMRCSSAVCDFTYLYFSRKVWKSHILPWMSKFISSRFMLLGILYLMLVDILIFRTFLSGFRALCQNAC